MKLILCILLGYLIGMISPSALLSKLKNVNMKQAGTGNLGASNAILLLGKGYGMLVMVIDILKAFLACHIGQRIFPDWEIAAYVTGFGTVLGHVYPFYLHFKGGKGLACYGGMVCYYNVWLLLFYLTGGVLLMILANRSIFLAVFVTISFPVILLLTTGNWNQFLVVTIASVFLLSVHRKNFGRAKRGEEEPMRDIIRNKIFKKSKK